MKTKKLLFILNPRAGRNKPHGPLFDALAILSGAGYLIRIHETSAPGDAADTAAREGAGYDLVVAAGGDGTLNEVISGLMRLDAPPPLGYLPQGTTNDFASSLQIPRTPASAAKNIVQNRMRELDIGRWNERSFIYVASFGAFTRSSYAASQAAKNALGHFAYILEGIKNLDSLRPYRCAVEADGEMFDGDFIFGAVCNSTSLGGLVKLDPKRVHMDDGMFELMLLRMPKTALDLQNLITALNRMDYDYPGVIFRHVRSVTVTTREDIPWSLDGEYAPSAPRVEIRNLHSAVPAKPPPWTRTAPWPRSIRRHRARVTARAWCSAAPAGAIFWRYSQEDAPEALIRDRKPGTSSDSRARTWARTRRFSSNT